MEGVYVDGILESTVATPGQVVIGPAAVWKGDCRAGSVWVAEGARIEGGCFQVGRPPEEPNQGQP